MGMSVAKYAQADRGGWVDAAGNRWAWPEAPTQLEIAQLVDAFTPPTLTADDDDVSIAHRMVAAVLEYALGHMTREQALAQCELLAGWWDQ